MEVKPALADLGKRMFYDTRLSGDTTLSCASCHQPAKAFTDGEALSAAYSGAAHFRYTPTPTNVGYRGAWMHDGRLGTNLNDVAREMIAETYLMNMDMRSALASRRRRSAEPKRRCSCWWPRPRPISCVAGSAPGPRHSPG